MRVDCDQSAACVAEVAIVASIAVIVPFAIARASAETDVGCARGMIDVRLHGYSCTHVHARPGWGRSKNLRSASRGSF